MVSLALLFYGPVRVLPTSSPGQVMQAQALRQLMMLEILHRLGSIRLFGLLKVFQVLMLAAQSYVMRCTVLSSPQSCASSGEAHPIARKCPVEAWWLKLHGTSECLMPRAQHYPLHIASGY